MSYSLAYIFNIFNSGWTQVSLKQLIRILDKLRTLNK